MVYIHDKTPEGRRKLKEGPKAQERYVEELMNEWVDDHATKTAPPPEGAMPPQDVQDRYAQAEEQARAIQADRIQARIEKLEPIVRTEAVARIAAQDMQLYGHLRESTHAEMLELGLDPMECGVIPPPAND